MRMHAVNVIQPLSKDERNKLAVRVMIVVADSREDAMRLVANYVNAYELRGDWRIVYRNEWEPGEAVVWTHQTWERNEWSSDWPTAESLAAA